MLLACFDTETTGLPIWKEPSEHPDQPHIVQLALVVRDAHDKKLPIAGEMNRLIKPDGWTIPPEVTTLHGITTEQAMDAGVPLNDALDEFLSLVQPGEQLVGFGLPFDVRMVRIQEKRRHKGVDDNDLPIGLVFAGMKRQLDLCKFMTKYCNLPPTEKMMAAGRKTAKTPSLQEAFSHAYPGKALDGKFHDAMGDVKATLAIYWWLYQEGGLGSGQDAEG